MIRVERDPASATLDRVQIIKGWVEVDGTTSERIYDVAWAGDRSPDAEGRVPAVGDTVDRRTGALDDSIGASILSALWIDPDFDPERAAFWYVRALEIPTPRHAQLDAIALGLDAPTEGPQVIQERAYTSPIWYRAE